jgi:hypothetical protein
MDDKEMNTYEYELTSGDAKCTVLVTTDIDEETTTIWFNDLMDGWEAIDCYDSFVRKQAQEHDTPHIRYYGEDGYAWEPFGDFAAVRGLSDEQVQAEYKTGQSIVRALTGTVYDAARSEEEVQRDLDSLGVPTTEEEEKAQREATLDWLSSIDDKHRELVTAWRRKRRAAEQNMDDELPTAHPLTPAEVAQRQALWDAAKVKYETWRATATPAEIEADDAAKDADTLKLY